jgi:hypothetical protein
MFSVCLSGGVMVENLVPRSTYDADETGYWRRLPLAAGVGFGLPMGIFFTIMVAIMAWGKFGLKECLLLGILSGAASGVLFGFFFPRAFRRKMSSITDANYLREPQPDILTSSAKKLVYRLPSNWMRSDSFAVGGVLYIGGDGLLFVPHEKNLQRDRSSFEMGPASQLRLSLAPTSFAGWKWFLVPRPAPFLKVAWPAGEANFLISSPQNTLELIEKALRELS